MAIDPSIALGVKPVQIESPLNMLAQVAQVQGAQQQNQLLGLKMQEEQRSIADTNALRTGLSAPGADPYKVLLQQGRIKEATEYQKGAREADKAKVDLVNAKLQQSKQFLDNVTTPEQYMQWHQANHADPVLGPELAARGVTPETASASIQQALAQPGGFQELLAKSRLGLDKFMELNKPTTTVVNAGGTSQVMQTPGLGGTPQVVGTVAHTQTPDSAATIAAANQRQTAQLAQSATQHAATLKKDYDIAGLNPDGTPGTANDAMIDAIGQYKVAPPNGMALRNPRMQQILAQVAEKYPDFDATQYGARQQAAKAFSTGKDAQNVQAANTALNHLDTIEQLALAQKNGNFPLFNKLANAFAAQTGQPTPTSLAAAISMVAPELTKAVVGTGGGVGERADFAHNLQPNGSPEQILRGVGTIKELLGGRLTEVQRTYERTTGRKDFNDAFLSPAAQKILAARAPGATGAATAGGVPLVNAQGWALHTDAKGNRAYVSPDGKQFTPVK